MQDWVVDVVRQMGPLGVALLMFLENVFPPLPSEVIMPLAGYLSARGQAPFWVMVAAGSAGSLAGAALWYAVGRAVTHDRLCAWVQAHGTWLAMTPADVDRAAEWFARHGRWSVFFGRLVPVVRTLISVPAGFTRMPAAPFLATNASWHTSSASGSSRVTARATARHARSHRWASASAAARSPRRTLATSWASVSPVILLPDGGGGESVEAGGTGERVNG